MRKTPRGIILRCLRESGGRTLDALAHDVYDELSYLRSGRDAALATAISLMNLIISEHRVEMKHMDGVAYFVLTEDGNNE